MSAPTARCDSDEVRIRQVLQDAERLCLQRGSRLTALRGRVLEIIWRSHNPLGAYAILDILRADGRRGAPPTVYRALDFLLEQGLIHRLASRNLFIGCPHPGDRHQGQFLICQRCGKVSEIDSPHVARAIDAEAAERQFEVQCRTVEILGHCRLCRRAGPVGTAPR
jgi:Fur family zinc uptake transcriptional regulator